MLENEMDRGQPTPEKAQAAEPTGRLSSRRGFLSGSAKLLGGGALALGQGAPVALAQGSGDGVTDVKILNYALTLERLEYEFYRRMLSRFSERQIENADIFDGLGGYVRRTIHENFVRIREHE